MVEKIDLQQIQQNGATNGQAMVWDTATGQWRPGTVASEGGGGTGTSTPGWNVVAAGTGASQNITLPEAVSVSDVLVFVNGLRQTPTTDYTITALSLTITVRDGAVIYIEKPGGADGTDGANGTNGTNGTNGAGVQTGGTTGQTLVKTSNADFATAWADSIATIVFVLNGGGFALEADEQVDASVGFNGHIFGAYVLADELTTFQGSLWLSSYANYPPVSANTVFQVALTNERKAEVVASPGTEVPFGAGDVMRINIDNNDNAKRITVILKVRKTS